MTIELELNDTQQLIQQTARDYFTRSCGTDVVRELEASEPGFSQEMWTQMAGLGWLGMTIPEQYGGVGGEFMDMYPLYEEIGRYLVPSPHLDTVVVAGEAILAAGSEAQKERFLRPIVEGTLVVSPAILEPGGEQGSGGVTLTATAEGQSYRLDGTKLMVPWAASAGYLLVAARTAAGSGPEGISLFMVDAQSGGVSMERLPNTAGYPLFAVTFEGVSVPADDLLGAPGRGWAPLSAAMTKGAVLQSAAIVGMGQKVLDITSDYAKNRVQFGRPIGTFQAVQYLTTDILLASHQARLLTMQAAWRIQSGLSYEREASIAKAFASKAASMMTRNSHEVHAGIAFMLDYDVQLYMRRAKYWETNLGDARYHQEQLAAVTL